MEERLFHDVTTVWLKSWTGSERRLLTTNLTLKTVWCSPCSFWHSKSAPLPCLWLCGSSWNRLLSWPGQACQVASHTWAFTYQYPWLLPPFTLCNSLSPVKWLRKSTSSCSHPWCASHLSLLNSLCWLPGWSGQPLSSVFPCPLAERDFQSQDFSVGLHVLTDTQTLGALSQQVKPSWISWSHYGRKITQKGQKEVDLHQYIWVFPAQVSRWVSELLRWFQAPASKTT